MCKIPKCFSKTPILTLFSIKSLILKNSELRLDENIREVFWQNLEI